MENKHNSQIAIIGAGIIGLATAWQCAKQGLSVTLFEKDKILARMGNSGCSAYSLGSLVPYTPTRQHDTANFQRASLAQYPQFLDALEADSGIKIHYQKGRVQLLDTAGKMESVKQDLRINPNQGKLLPKEELATEFPYLNPSDFGAFFCNDSAYVNHRQMLSALLLACQKSNVNILENQNVNIDKINNNFKHIIVAAGNNTNATMGNLFTEETEVESMYGHGIELSLSEKNNLPKTLPLIRKNEIYLCRHEDKMWIGSDTTRAQNSADTLPEKNAVEHILKEAINILPELKNATPKIIWRAPRPKAKNRAAPIRHINKNITLLTGHYKIGFCVTPKIATDVAKHLKQLYM